MLTSQHPEILISMQVIKQDTNTHIIYWLAILIATIFTMIVVGGITRLTDSGLSMVEWRPLLGTLPPMTDAEWQRVFSIYKEYPQYQLVNRGMSMEEFQFIFYWEWGHRVLGRFIGVLFAIPFLYFLIRGMVPSALKSKLWVALFLGGAQGLMGWYMVKSGLVDEPLVSHYRLAAHLSLALIIFAYLSWLLLDQLNLEQKPISAKFRVVLNAFSVLLVVQIVYGAFVAGNRAGFGYNTYPMMNDVWLPEIAMSLSPLWHNLVDNNAMLQFIHRWLAVVVLGFATWLVWIANTQEDRRIKISANMLLGAVIGQFLLGVLTLIYVVPVSLGSIHQAGACVVVLCLVVLQYRAMAEAKVTVSTTEASAAIPQAGG
jgi:cytochrome c oxidase assembly protein subunit 15